jgi:hypothetical protein
MAIDAKRGFADLLRDFRVAAGLSQEELAARRRSERARHLGP